MRLFTKLLLIIILSCANILNVNGNVSPSINYSENSASVVTNKENVRPIEPRKALKSSTKKQQFRKQKTNKGPRGWFHISSILIISVLLFGLICLPLGVALGMYWLWMSALFVLALPIGLLFIIIIKDIFRRLKHNNPTREIFKLFGFAFLLLVVIDLIITGLIAGIFSLWFVPAVLLITVGLFALILEFAMR